MECSVTLEVYRDPRVLPCGHSIEWRVALEMLRRHTNPKCPVCLEKWCTEPPPNWALRDVLNITDEPDKQHANLAKEMGNTSAAVVSRMVQTTLSHVMKQIRKKSAQGYTSHSICMYDMIFPFFTPFDVREKIMKSMVTLLKKNGFKAFIFGSSTRIDW